jgi:hypothetical protein
MLWEGVLLENEHLQTRMRGGRRRKVAELSVLGKMKGQEARKEKMKT